MDRMEQVKHLRTDPGGRHYNCAQSILVPFADEAGLEEEQAYQLGAMFGSGMNHGATCGVITSALMLLGLKGYSTKEAGELLRRFREEHQATECAALLTRAKEAGVTRKEHCNALVFEMVQALEELLAQK